MTQVVLHVLKNLYVNNIFFLMLRIAKICVLSFSPYCYHMQQHLGCFILDGTLWNGGVHACSEDGEYSLKQSARNAEQCSWLYFSLGFPSFSSEKDHRQSLPPSTAWEALSLLPQPSWQHLYFRVCGFPWLVHWHWLHRRISSLYDPRSGEDPCHWVCADYTELRSVDSGVASHVESSVLTLSILASKGFWT